MLLYFLSCRSGLLFQRLQTGISITGRLNGVSLLQKLTAIENGPSIDSRDGKLFRRRFRVPWQVYCDLVLKCRNERVFNLNSLRDYDVCGTAMCAIEIKLLGVLRMLGWNWISDDVAEATGMGESTVRSCFHLFCTNFVNKFYHEFIYRPKGVKLQI